MTSLTVLSADEEKSKQIEEIRRKIYEHLKWSSEERVFRKRYDYRNPLLINKDVPFSTATKVKFRRSVFGTYLKFFNQPQHQNKFLNENKLGITEWRIKQLGAGAKLVDDRNNDATEDLFGLLKKAVVSVEEIEWDYLFAKLKLLRIIDYYITSIDRFVHKFENLQVLVLSGNFIRDISGEFLPRSLFFLELYANEIDSFDRLCDGIPPTLMHLGLGRNKISDASLRHLPHFCGGLPELRTLDLSDNDIYNLVGCVEALKPLNSLTALFLEGNPCSVCWSYKDAVLYSLPSLLYLDNTEILSRDRHPHNFQEGIDKSSLIFTCHKITGLPSPPKDKKTVQTFHLEVKLPLLEEIILEPEPVEEPVEATEEKEEKKDKKEKGKKGKKDKKSDKSSKKSKDKSSKKSKGKGKGKGKKTETIYDAEDEYAIERANKIKDTSFKTARVSWSNIIRFPVDAIALQNDPKLIRDTFKTAVNVKLVYLQVEPPAKADKKKGKSKGGSKKDKKDKKKGDSKKDKKGKKSGKSSSTVVSKESIKEPTETIIKKITIGDFNCDLRNVNWSQETIDFFWAKHSAVGSKAIFVEGNLREINYVEGKKGKKGKPASPKKSKPTEEVAIDPQRQPMPSYITCHVGFGLQRSYKQ